MNIEAMAGRTTGKKFIMAVVILSMVVLCTFSRSMSDERDVYYGVTAIHRTNTVMRGGLMKKVDGAKLLESSVTSTVKAVEEVSRSRQNGRSSRLVFDLGLAFQSVQMGLSSAFAPALLGQCEMTPRYSVITYLHLSDGKKPSSLLA